MPARTEKKSVWFSSASPLPRRPRCGASCSQLTASGSGRSPPTPHWISCDGNYWPQMPFQVLEAEARSILSPTSGFIAEAGFTHSLTPARNCTFGCSYCYVPTMRVYGGLKPQDWSHWGQFTTFKSNAPDLLRRQLRSDQVIYCSPLVDPYQPAEETQRLMPQIFDELCARPPKIFTIQTRGPLILRDLDQLIELSRCTSLRV